LGYPKSRKHQVGMEEVGRGRVAAHEGRVVPQARQVVEAAAHRRPLIVQGLHDTRGRGGGGGGRVGDGYFIRNERRRATCVCVRVCARVARNGATRTEGRAWRSEIEANGIGPQSSLGGDRWSRDMVSSGGMQRWRWRQGVED
jgi:hypothetical protein